MLLALLLACTPLLAAAQPLLMAAADHVPATVTDGAAAHLHATMPCHDAATADDPLQHADCPHCNGDAPPNQCQCGDHAAPSGVALLATANLHRITDGTHYRATLPDPLPASRSDRPFRPPIASR